MPATKEAHPTPAAASPKAAAPARAPGKRAGATNWSGELRKFLIERGEKLVFAGSIVGCLVLSVTALRHLPYGKSPEDMKAQTKKVSDELESTKSVAAVTKKLPKGPNVKTLKTLAAKKTPARAYAMAPLRVPYQERQLRRGEPTILPVERLLASSGYGPIAIQGKAPAPTLPRPPAATEKPGDAAKLAAEERKKRLDERNKNARRTPPKSPKEEKKPAEEPVATKPVEKPKSLLPQAPAESHLEYRNWVCLVAATPYVAQINEYQRAFHEALYQSTERDQPRYALPEIERAEVVGKRRLRWRPVNVIASLEDHATWATEYPESLDNRLIDPELTGLLPPLVSVNYEQAKVTHPRVKVVVVEQPKPLEEKPADAKEPAAAGNEKKVPQPILGGLRDKKPPPKEAAPAAVKPSDNKEAPEKSPGPPPIEIIRYRLFRFFDFDVEPGKVYRYRVKLVALNPNYDLPTRFLTTPEDAQGIFREGPWSAPSPAVAVVDGSRLMAGNVVAGNVAAPTAGDNDKSAGGSEDAEMLGPIAQVLVHFYDFATSQRANVLFDAGRGSLLNQANVALNQPEGTANQPKKGRTANSQRETEQQPTLDVQTGAVVVDLFGGDPVPGVRGRSMPGHVLVLDQYGVYKTLMQADDAATFEKELPSVATPTGNKPGAEQARK
ncbi:MAG TPA: hypothetical protein VHC22_25375 [Pirellulales bacterium]|nr:hypothetical protein [Pirellulales bacterium]